MRIAHVLSSFALGGQEQIAADLSAILQARGHEVLAVALDASPGELEASFNASGVRTQHAPRSQGLDPSLPLRLATRLGRFRPDVVHTHNPQALVYGAPAGRLAGARVVHTKHGVNPDPPRRRMLRRAAAACVDAYVAVTPELASIAASAHECNQARLFVVPNGIDTTRFAPDPAARSAVRNELGIAPDAWVVGTVGRLAAEKDQAMLIRAAAPLLADDARLVVVGDGVERSRLDALAAELAPGRVHFAGARRDVERWLPAFDVFALPSRTEGLPLVLLEAMASGVGVVATRVGGVPDLVTPGVTGLLAEPGDAAGFRRELVRLRNDDALTARVARAGRQRVLERYSAERMASEYESLYQQVREGRWIL